jgi:NAD(P)-dependent dehydrogenase (short-subunit alcohol dehydrogenase family)
MAKWTTADIPDQTGRVAVITGSNTGLGYETAAALAAKGAHVVMAVRNLDKGKDAAALIQRSSPNADVALQELDLTSLDSIRAAAEQLRATHDHIDLLINNAGVMYTPKSHTKDGFEMQFGTNHLGHFAFTGLLLDRLSPVAGSRVVTISSIGHRIRADIHFDDLQWEHSYNRVSAYGQAKLANLLFTYELQHLPRWAASIYPVIEPIFQDASMGALPQLRAATDPAVLGGQYYGPDGLGQTRGYPKIVGSSKKSHDAERQRRLWAVSEELTGVTYPVG